MCIKLLNVIQLTSHSSHDTIYRCRLVDIASILSLQCDTIYSCSLVDTGSILRNTGSAID